jgi:O-antigen ligase
VQIPSLRAATSGANLRLSLFVLAGVFAAIAGGIAAAAVSPFAGLAAALTLPIALAILRDRRIGLIAVIGVAYLLPFGVLPVPIGGVRLTFLDATMTLLLVVVLFRALVHAEERLVTTPIDLLVVVFIGVALAAFAVGIESTTAEVFRFFLKSINGILFFFSVTNTVRTRRDLIWVTLALIAGGVSAAALGILFYLLPVSLANQLLGYLRVIGYPARDAVRFIAGTAQVRATGTSIDPNVLGGMLILAIPPAVAQALSPAPLLRRRYFIAGAAVMLVGLALTFSRGSWAGCIAGLIFIATLRYRRLWALLFLFVAVLFAAPQGDLLLDRIASGIAFQDRAAAMRLGEYRDALRLIAAYPWLGVGFGGAPTIDLYVSVASIYLLIAESMGLVGLSSFLAVVGVTFAYALRGRRAITDATVDSLQVGALAGTFAALTAGIFDHYFFNLHFPHTVALFWLIVALTLAATRLRADPSTSDPASMPAATSQESDTPSARRAQPRLRSS